MSPKPSSSKPHLASSIPSFSEFEEEERIDLRPYLQALTTHWPLIVGVSLSFGLLVLLLIYFGRSTYTAEANISLLNVRSNVIFDPSFTTIPNVPSPYLQEDDRGTALRALATSPSLLSDVEAELASALEQPPAQLNEIAHVGTSGDLLRLRVTWTDPEAASKIANLWAQRYIEVANHSYINTSSTTPEEAQQATEAAFARYQEAQKEFEAFIASSKLRQLKHEAVQVKEILSTLELQRTNALLLANTLPITSTGRLAEATSQALLDQIAYPVERSSADQLQKLNNWYVRRTTLENLQKTLADLEAQLANGQGSAGAASGDFLALMFTRAGIFGTTENIESQLQINISDLVGAGGDVTAEDVQALQDIVSEGIIEANEEITRVTGEVFSGSELEAPTLLPEEHELLQRVNEQVASILNVDFPFALDSADLENSSLSRQIALLSNQLQELESQVESLEARQRELMRERDTAWELFTTLDNKSREVEAQFATGIPQVRLSLAAAVPTTPDRRNLLKNTLLAAIAGAVLGTFFVLGREVWRSSFSLPATPPVTAPKEPAWGQFDEIPQGLILLNSDKSIRYLNRAASRLLNTGEGTFKGRPIRALRQPELADAVAALTSEGATIYREALLGQDRRLLIGAMPLPSRASEDETEFIVVLQELSGVPGARVDLGPLLTELAAQLPGSEDSQPAANGEKRSLPSTNTESHQVIHLQGEVESVVDRLAFLEQAEAGLGERRMIHLKRLAQEVITDLLPLATSKQIDIKEELPATLPPLLANHEQMYEVLKELLDNAVKYSPSHTKVRLRAKVEEDSLTLAILDSGIGIWVKDIPFLFDRYYRVQASEVQAVSGHGLGLATVKAVVEAHGGRAWAESRPGTGSIFFVKLPLTTQVQPRTPATLGNGNGSKH